MYSIFIKINYFVFSFIVSYDIFISNCSLCHIHTVLSIVTTTSSTSIILKTRIKLLSYCILNPFALFWGTTSTWFCCAKLDHLTSFVIQCMLFHFCCCWLMIFNFWDGHNVGTEKKSLVVFCCCCYCCRWMVHKWCVRVRVHVLIDEWVSEWVSWVKVGESCWMGKESERVYVFMCSECRYCCCSLCCLYSQFNS